MNTMESVRETLLAGGIPPTMNVGRAIESSSKVPPAKSPTTSKGPANRPSDRFRVLNGFVDHSAQLLSLTAQAAWYVIYRDVKTNGLASLAHSQIAEKIGVTRRTVVRAVKELEAKGLITVEKRGGLNRGSNVYSVHATPRRVTSTPPRV